MTDPWLTVVGCLPGGAVAPGAPADALHAAAVFGPARLLDVTAVTPERRRPWPSPFADGIAALLSLRGTPVTVLASGDPLNHGVAATLLRHVAPEEMRVFPAPSAFSLAAAALLWPLAEVAQVSLHTAPPEAILGHVAPGRRILALTRDGKAPALIAAALTRAGYGDAALAVCADLGGPGASVYRTRAGELTGEMPALNVLALECGAGPAPLSVDALTHDGCVTRDEVRALTLAALGAAPVASGHLWDVGSGSGSVAIDWIRRGGTATLFERHPGRLAAIAANLAATGTASAATVLSGDAAAALPLAADPTHIFMGGAVGDAALFEALWARLPAGGIFLSNAVTALAEAETIRRHARLGGRLTRIALSHDALIGGLTALKPAMPVLQWRATRS
ncbi:precorrin-6Y C5,15-methyltransferase (decarboxylating) protein [Stappia sp. 22II-S9-Z10]|nr:precorrin-6Y C5,15-methyltransferase (decarboxylating) protein [Stappia sp. 22II-S9-Z10]